MVPYYLCTVKRCRENVPLVSYRKINIKLIKLGSKLQTKLCLNTKLFKRLITPGVVSSQINSNEKPSYAHTASKRNTASNSDNHDSTVPQAPSLASFLEEFKSLITPLISLLTSLITKLISHNDKQCNKYYSLECKWLIPT
ncbi:uncharacterized protein LOC111036577 [Myzus persicae]|uniref:uncharacterized protein LOC111036577 n=1 Tax=Myzus persicae TaxID=13164 RepID=UPI000B93872F|nr:uncharacterized protein LOC111036577 [Myzus persicae]